MPNRGDRFYRCDSDGSIETAVFLEENIADGASIPSWVVRTHRGRVRISRENSYRTTKRAALLDHIADLRTGLKHGRERIAETKRQMKEHRELIKKAKEQIEQLKSEGKA